MRLPSATATDILALRYFLAAARRNSVSAAARDLGVTQPAVSRQVKALEGVLGVALFHREGRTIRLTDAGRELETHAADIVERVALLPERVSAASREPEGRLAFGVPYTFGEFIVPPVLKRFRARYPKVQVWITQGYSGEIAALLSQGALDVGLIYGAAPHPDIAMEPLIGNELGLVAPPRALAPGIGGRSVTLAQVLDLPLILPGRSHGLRELVEDAAARRGRAPRVAVEVDNPVLAKTLVREGLGCMLLAYSGAVREFKAGELRFLPVVAPRLQWPLSIATNRGKLPSLARGALIREIVDATRRGLRRHAWRGRLILSGEATAGEPAVGTDAG